MKFIYATYRNADMTEGRGPMVMDCCFTNESLARQYIDPKFGVMGRKSEKGWSNEEYGDWEVKKIPVYETLKEAGIYPEEFRKQALAKLSPEEREVLGLK